MKKVITLGQSKEWSSYIERTSNHDFYHTPTYHSLDESGVPLLFVYEEERDFIAIPLIKREIPKTGFYDFTSVYGYCGPFANKCFKDLEESFLLNFKNHFLDFLKKEKIVSIFTRIHPFFDQHILLNKFGGVFNNGEVIALDLTIPLDEQRAKYQNTVFRHIKKLNNKGYVVKEAKKPSDIAIFHSMYTASMRRHDAQKSYFFSKRYFKHLLNSKEINAKLLFVYNEAGDPICGATVIFTNQISQVHLLATNPNYYSKSPSRFLIDEITIIGRRLGMKYCNLGGGLGYKEDSLFNWKASFSNLRVEYNTWRYIVNKDIYSKIMSKYGIDDHSKIDLFPKYRFSPPKL